MAETSSLWTIETRLWKDGIEAYEAHMAPECVMVFPAPVGIMDHAAILEVLRQAPRWDDVEFDRQVVIHPSPDVATLAYLGRGQRGTDTYEAFCSSTYCRRSADWMIVQHQQTPVGD